MVYCEELGRSSPYADHDRKVIRDNLDDFGHTFIAVDDGKTIGTLRANLAASGDAASSYGEENQMAGFRRDELGRDAG